MSPDIDDTASAGIAVIMTEIGHIKTTLDEIKASLKEVPKDYVTRVEFGEAMLTRDREIKDLKDRHKEVKQSVEKVEESIATDRRAKHIPLPMTITTVVGVGGFILLLIEKITT